MDVKALLAKTFSLPNVTEEEIYSLIKKADGVQADYAMPCFKFAKAMGMPPQKIAENLASSITDGLVREAKAVNGYLNMFLDRAYIQKTVLGDVVNDRLRQRKNGLHRLQQYKYRKTLPYRSPRHYRNR